MPVVPSDPGLLHHHDPPLGKGSKTGSEVVGVPRLLPDRYACIVRKHTWITNRTKVFGHPLWGEKGKKARRLRGRIFNPISS